MNDPLLILVLCALSAAAHAQAPGRTPLSPGQAAADGAREAYREGRFAEAAQGYLASWQATREPLVLKNAVKVFAVHLGDCDQTLRWGAIYLETRPEAGRAQEVAGYQAECLQRRAEAQLASEAYTGARTSLEQAQRLPLAVPARAKVEAALARVAHAEANQPVNITVKLTGPGDRPLASPAELRLDGRPATRSATGALRVRPGQHTLVVSAEGYRADSRTFVAKPGVVLAIQLSPRPAATSETTPTSPATARLRVAGYSALGVALVAAGVGVAFDIGGQSTIDDLEQVGAAGTDRARYDDLRADAEQAQTATWVLYGTAAAAGVAAAVLLGLAYGTPELGLSPSPNGLSVGGTW